MKLFGWELRRSSLVPTPTASVPAADSGALVQTEARNANIVSMSSAPDWMGPMDGLQALAPFAAVGGRSWDFGVGYNMQTTPRAEEMGGAYLPVPGMLQLRQLADACEIIRILIETRKDQLTGLNWRFRKRDSKRPDHADPGVKRLEEFFAFPDGVNDFEAWLRMWVEDLCVLDAPSIYARRFSEGSRKGEVAALEILDGARIKVLLDERGRRPAAPMAAYTHILKGIPATHYSTWDLVYTPRNRRAFGGYGFSPVEQIKTFASMMIRRQALQLGYFTEGNVPDCIVPIRGTAEQVAKFQATFDAQTMGGQKVGKLIFLPMDNADKLIQTKDAVVVDKFDEWLARVACAAFSEPVTPFVSQVNRATAETAVDSSAREGLHVQIRHVLSVLNRHIIQHPMMLNMPGYEIYVAPEPQTDPEKAAKIAIPAVAAGIMRVDEARDMLGLYGDAPTPAQPAVPAQEPQETVEPETVRMARAASLQRRQDASRARAMAHETALADRVGNWLQRMARKVAADLAAVKRAEGSDDLAAAITAADLTEFSAIVEATISEVYGLGAADAVADFLAADAAMPLVPVLRNMAVEAAAERGAWLVGRRIEDGKVVDAIRPEYRITDEMRESIRRVVSEASAESYTTEALTQALEASPGFSRTRATTIARTEIVNAHEMGKAQGWEQVERETGEALVKRSILAANENHGPNDIIAAERGWIPTGEAFVDGMMGPPYHPNCLCTSVARKASSVKGNA